MAELGHVRRTSASASGNLGLATQPQFFTRQPPTGTFLFPSAVTQSPRRGPVASKKHYIWFQPSEPALTSRQIQSAAQASSPTTVAPPRSPKRPKLPDIIITRCLPTRRQLQPPPTRGLKTQASPPTTSLARNSPMLSTTGLTHSLRSTRLFRHSSGAGVI